MQEYIQFTSPYSVKVNINNEYCFFLKQNEIKRFEIDFEESFFIDILSSHNNYTFIPTLIEFFIQENKLCCKNNNIKIIDFGKNTYQIIIVQNPIINNNIIIEKEFNNKNVTINNNVLTIQYKNKTFSYSINKLINNIKIINKKNYTIIIAKNDNKNYLHISNQINGEFKEIICDTFNMFEEYIKVGTKINDYYKHYNIVQYDFNSNLNTSSTTTHYIDEPKEILNHHIIPYIALQNIKMRDYKNAIKYFSSDLKEKLSPIKLSEYFGKFDLITTPQIELNDNTICLCYKKNSNNYYCRYFCFEFTNNLISNIIEIELP